MCTSSARRTLLRLGPSRCGSPRLRKHKLLTHSVTHSVMPAIGALGVDMLTTHDLYCTLCHMFIRSTLCLRYCV